MSSTEDFYPSTPHAPPAVIGAPYGYAQPHLLPRRRTRPPFVVLGIVLVVFVAAAVAAGATLLRPHRHLHLHLVAGVGLTPSADPVLLRAAAGFNDRHLVGFHAAAFDRPSAHGVLVIGGDVAAHDPADQQRDLRALAAGVAHATVDGNDGNDGDALAGLVDEPAGGRGGRVQCTSVSPAGRTGPATLCLWRDADTAGILVGDDDVTATAALLARYRQVAET